MNGNAADFLVYQKVIESLILEGCSILQIINPDGSCVFFSVFNFTESYFNSAQSLDFNTVEGVNITDFLTKQSANYSNRTSFIAMYNATIDESPVVRCQFYKTAQWFLWMQVGDDRKRRL